MKISVVVFVWNMEKTLKKSIDSIIKNIEAFNYECILVDGNSDDESKNICLDYQKTNTNVTYIKLTQYDENKMWNLGLNYATGDYIYFTKGCTFLCENFIQDALNYLDINPDTDVYIRNYQNLVQNKLIPIYHFFETQKIGPRLPMCIFRKSAINSIQFIGNSTEHVFSGKVIYTHKYYFERNNVNSFIDTEYYGNYPKLTRCNMYSHLNWIEYSRNEINEYIKNINNYEKL